MESAESLTPFVLSEKIINSPNGKAAILAACYIYTIGIIGECYIKLHSQNPLGKTPGSRKKVTKQNNV
jgi:hypothetical protein